MQNRIDRRTLLSTSGAGLAMSLCFVRPARAQDAAKPTPPAAPMPSVDVFARTPMVDQITLSPDGKRVAVITQDGDNKVLLYFDVADIKMRRVTIGPAKIRDLFWGDNDHVVLVNSTTTSLPQFAGRRQEINLASSLDLKTAKLRTFFSSEDGFYNIVMGNLQRIKVDGLYRVTASSYQLTGGYNLCLYSFGFDTSKGHLITEGSNTTQNFVITPEGLPVAYAELDEDRKQWNLYYNTELANKRVRFKCVYRQEGNVLNSPDLVGLGRDGNSAVIRTYIGDDGQADYHEISSDGVLSAPLDPTGNDKQRHALFHPTTLRLAGFTRHDDTVSRLYFDPLMKKLEDALPQVLGEDFRLESRSYGEDPRKMIAYSEGKGDAGSYYYIDFSTGQVVPIATNYPDLPAEWITQKQAINYKAADGLDIHGYLTLPPFRDAKNLPLVVLPHGGPQARDYIDFDWQAQTLASRGYAVLQPNFRGSEGYGDNFIIAGHGEWGRKMQTDLSDGVRYLAAQGIVDPKRVAIFGASYGGYAALACATLDQGVYRCAVAIAGPSDLKSFMDFQRDNSVSMISERILYWKEFLGDTKQYDDISPARQADKAYCPILLIHGTDDTVVPIEQSKHMERALKAAGKPVEFLTYKGQDHWETVASARVTMMQASVDFLIQHNPPS